MNPDDQQVFYGEIGSRIRRAREARGMTQEALAALVNLTRTSITNIEKGRQKLLLHTLAELAVVLGVEPTVLLPGREVATEGNERMEALLKDQDQREQAWIRAALNFEENR